MCRTFLHNKDKNIRRYSSDMSSLGNYQPADGSAWPTVETADEIMSMKRKLPLLDNTCKTGWHGQKKTKLENLWHFEFFRSVWSNKYRFIYLVFILLQLDRRRYSKHSWSKIPRTFPASSAGEERRRLFLRVSCINHATHLSSRISGDKKRVASSSWLLCRLLCWLLCWLLHRRRDRGEPDALHHPLHRRSWFKLWFEVTCWV